MVPQHDRAPSDKFGGANDMGRGGPCRVCLRKALPTHRCVFVLATGFPDGKEGGL